MKGKHDVPAKHDNLREHHEIIELPFELHFKQVSWLLLDRSSPAERPPSATAAAEPTFDKAKEQRILDECHYLDQNYVMYGPRTKGDIVKAAGYKQNFDYALPETWLDGLPSPEARDEAMRWYVWSYDGIYSIFGPSLRPQNATRTSQAIRAQGYD